MNDNWMIGQPIQVKLDQLGGSSHSSLVHLLAVVSIGNRGHIDWIGKEDWCVAHATDPIRVFGALLFAIAVDKAVHFVGRLGRSRVS